MIMKEYTSIRLLKIVKNRLDRRKRYSETYSDLMNRLLSLR